MADLIAALAPLGIGGVLAAFIFWFYRQDRIACKGREEMLVETLERYAEEQQAVALGIQELVKAVHLMMAQQRDDMRVLINNILRERSGRDTGTVHDRSHHGEGCSS